MKKALLFDSNTVKKEYIPAVSREVSGNGEVLLKRAYGYADAASRTILVQNGFYAALSEQAENRIPCGMLVDLLELLTNDEIQEIHLATNDAYVLPVVLKIRACGKTVTVYGNEDMPDAFINCCGRFRYLEILDGKLPEHCMADLKEIISDIHTIIIEERASGTCLTASKLLCCLENLHPDFDIRNYGYTTFEELITKNIEDILLYKENGELMIEKTENREQVERFITAYLSERENKVEDMAELLDALAEHFAHFDIRNYGYTTDIAFILSFPKLEIYENKGVKLKRTFQLK